MAAKNSKEEEQLRQRNKELFQKVALHWNTFANEQLFEIGKQLLGIALVLLPLTGSIILSDKKINPNEIQLLVYSWIALFISIISGFINFWTSAKYFQYLSNDASIREVIWTDPTHLVSQMHKETVKLGPVKVASTFLPLIIQAVSLFLGILLITVVTYNLLSQPQESDNGRYKRERPHRMFQFK